MTGDLPLLPGDKLAVLQAMELGTTATLLTGVFQYLKSRLRAPAKIKYYYYDPPYDYDNYISIILENATIKLKIVGSVIKIETKYRPKFEPPRIRFKLFKHQRRMSSVALVDREIDLQLPDSLEQIFAWVADKRFR